MTQNQKEFLLKFFINENFAGWRNIATSLIENGYCIVAGSECIWKGGIGNFITTNESPKEYVDCIKYNFNLTEFLKCEWFKSNLQNKLVEVENEKLELKNIESELMELKNL